MAIKPPGLRTKHSVFRDEVFINHPRMVFDILFSLGIEIRSVMLGQKMCNLTVQIGVTFE